MHFWQQPLSHSNPIAERFKRLSHYTTFGSPMPTRSWSDPNSKYKYGFNGKEIDKGDEGMGGGGSTYDYGFRIYNSNLGRFLSVDPLSKSYPWYTPYQFAENKPIQCIDIDGLEEYQVILWVALDGSYGTRVHVVREDGPLIVTYYLRPQNTTQADPGYAGAGGCVECLPRGLQPTDQLIVRREEDKSKPGFTSDDIGIWETTFQMDRAADAMRIFKLHGSKKGAAGNDLTFDGSLVISQRTRLISGIRITNRTSSVINANESEKEATDENLKKTFGVPSELDAYINFAFSTVGAASSVTKFYARNAAHKKAIEESLSRLGRSATVVVNKKKVVNANSDAVFAYNIRTRTTATTTVTDTTTATITPNGAPTTVTTTPPAPTP